MENFKEIFNEVLEDKKRMKDSAKRSLKCLVYKINMNFLSLEKYISKAIKYLKNGLLNIRFDRADFFVIFFFENTQPFH